MGLFDRLTKGVTASGRDSRPPPQGHSLLTVEDLIQVLAESDCGLAHLQRVAREGDLRHWLRARLAVEDPLFAKVEALFLRQGARVPVLLFGLRYTLTPSTPLELLPGVSIQRPAELAPLVRGERRARDRVMQSLREMIADGRLAEWLRAAEIPAWEETLKALDWVRSHHPEEHDLPCWLLIWSYAPDCPFPFEDRMVATPPELARAIDASDQSRATGLALLDAGWIRTWLVATGQLRDTSAWDAAAGDLQAAPLVRLELVLRFLDPERPVPRLVARPAVLDFGVVRLGAVPRRLLRIENAQGGCIAGTLSLEDGLNGIRLSAVSFEATPAEVQVEMDPRGLAVGSRAEIGIRVHASGVETRVPVRYRVGVPTWVRNRRWMLAAGVLAGIVLWHHRGDHFVTWVRSGLETTKPAPTAFPNRRPSAQPNGAVTQEPAVSREEQRPQVRQSEGRPPASSVAVPPTGPPQGPPVARPSSSPATVVPGQEPPTLLPPAPDWVAKVRALMDQGRLRDALREADRGLGEQPQARELKRLQAELQGRIHEESLSPNDRTRVQRALTLLRFDTKGADGVFGPNTRAAIGRFQAANQAPETGWVTEAQVASLMTQAEPLLRGAGDQGNPPLQPLRGSGRAETGDQRRLPPGQVLCVGPGGSQVMDAVACRRAGGRQARQAPR